MAVADDALAEIFDVALLVRQQGAPRGLRPRLVPAIDRPLGRLGAVVVPQRLPAQSISRIARPISDHGFLLHFISKIAQPVSYHADGSCGLRGVTSSAMLAAACSGDIMLTLYSYPELFGVADNNGYGLKVFAFLRLAGVAFRHEHIFDASSAPPPQLPSLPHH